MAEGKIVFNMTWLGQQIRNVTTWSNVVFTGANLQQYADSIRDLYLETLSPILVNTWQLDSLTFYDVTLAEPYPIEVGFTIGPLIGGGSQQSNATQVALLASTIALSSPPNRGRVFLGGTRVDMLDDGLFTSPVRAAALAMVEGWAQGEISDDQDAPIFLRIARYNLDGSFETSNPVTSVIIREVPSTQRKRKIGVGM